MDRNEFYQLIGQITYSFGRIDFLISNIAVDLKLINEYPEFYTRNFKDKIIDLRKGAYESISDKGLLDEFYACLEKLDTFREERNRLIHSIVLESDNELMFYNFKKVKHSIVHDVKHYQFEEIRKFNTDFITLHNEIYTIREKLNLQ